MSELPDVSVQKIAKDILYIQGNIKVLEDKELAQNTLINQNAASNKMLRRELELLKSRFELQHDTQPNEITLVIQEAENSDSNN